MQREPLREWRMRIEDIVSAVETIQRYTAGLDLEGFRSNPMAVQAVLYNFVVIGEAAHHVPASVVSRYAEIDWRQMSGMRNVIVHEYFGARLETVWQTVKHDLPALLPRLRPLLDDRGGATD